MLPASTKQFKLKKVIYNLVTMKVVHTIAKVLVIIGGLNWGLIAINPDWNLVNMALGAWPVVERVVYGVVGVAALERLVKLFMCKGCCGGKCDHGKM